MKRWDPGLATWLAIATALLVSLAVASVSWVGTRLLGDLADAEARARAELGVTAAQVALRQELDELQRAATLLAARPTLRRYLATSDREGLESYMARYCEDAALDACAVLSGGDVVSAIGANVDWPGTAMQAGVPDTAFVIAHAEAGASLVGTASVTAETGAATVATLRRTDIAFMARLSESVGLSTHIVSDDRQTLPAERSVTLVPGADASTAPEYLATAALETLGSDNSLALQVRLPGEEVLAPVAALERRMHFIAVLVAGLATLTAILIGRYFIRGVKRLTRTAHEIGRGRLDAPVPPERGAELGVLATTMEQMRLNLLALEEARRVRDAILANISHEFRTPLAAQIASIELLRDGIDTLPPPARAQLVRSLERGARRLARLIDNLLESVRIESGQLGIRRQSVSLADVAQAAYELVEPLLEQRGQQLEITGLTSLPAFTGDRERLVQVFVNLLANASKFSPANTTLRIGGDAGGDGHVRAWVEDEGPGPVEESDLVLFEAFRRSSGDDPEASGLGLGLFIVKSIVERHGGRVWLERTDAGRTRAALEIPQSEAA